MIELARVETSGEAATRAAGQAILAEIEDLLVIDNAAHAELARGG